MSPICYTFGDILCLIAVTYLGFVAPVPYRGRSFWWDGRWEGWLEGWLEGALAAACLLCAGEPWVFALHWRFIPRLTRSSFGSFIAGGDFSFPGDNCLCSVGKGDARIGRGKISFVHICLSSGLYRDREETSSSLKTWCRVACRLE
jgi:hypothetical protein